MMPHSLADWYEHSGGMCCLHLLVWGGCRFIQNTDKHLQNYTVLQHRTTQYYMINIQSARFIMDCAWQLYGTENLHVLRHPTTAAVLLQDVNSCHTVSTNGSSGKHMYSSILLKCLPCH